MFRTDNKKNLAGYSRWLLFLMLLVLISPVCSKGPGGSNKKAPLSQEPDGQVIEKNGVIEPGDSTDANHSDLPYDAYTFTAKLGDKVTVKVVTEDFIPLLKLVEVATGAPLAEWDSQYSQDAGLTYTIAGPGKYEVRVYAMQSGTGNYSLRISVE